jgi:hypothetical protein
MSGVFNPGEGFVGMTDLQFMTYVDLRDKCEAQSREIILLREENAKLKKETKN